MKFGNVSGHQPYTQIAITAILVMAVQLWPGIAVSTEKDFADEVPRHPTLRNDAIDYVDLQWWDDNKTLLFVDVTFNFTVSVTNEITDKIQKTHILQLISTGSVARSYRKSYSGTEHQAIPERFRNIIEEIKYEGGGNGKANLVIYLYEPAVLSYRMNNNLKTLHIEISRLQQNESNSRPQP